MRLISVSASKILSRSVLGIILLTTFMPSAFAQSSYTLSQIENDYAGGNYKNALLLANSELNTFPTNPNLHYLKANILAVMGESSNAVGEYELTLKYNPSPTVRGYCEKALAVLLPQSHKDSAIAALDKEAGREVRHTTKQSVATGKQIQAESELYQQSHSARTAQIVSDMQNAGRYAHDGEWLPAYDPAEINAIASRREAKEKAVVRSFAQSSQDAQAAAEQRSDAMMDSAEGLKSLIAHPTRPGDAVIDPNGTNLFVRNYAEPASPSVVRSAPKPATVIVP